ncbi:hypothetical protein G4B88_004936 [Cannabis sativa]|uniref:Uncharacterized protein n=1 Tax=Cannabis sativa TaxID=3483 RepID=A0A7J6EA18_CANSA|nr:hypothetical protein G4B88_004936 [Cannabis sativa]
MPRVLRPGRVPTLTVVTFDPTGFMVFPGMLSPEKKKSSAFTSFGRFWDHLLPHRSPEEDLGHRQTQRRLLQPMWQQLN